MTQPTPLPTSTAATMHEDSGPTGTFESSESEASTDQQPREGIKNAAGTVTVSLRWGEVFKVRPSRRRGLNLLLVAAAFGLLFVIAGLNPRKAPPKLDSKATPKLSPPPKPQGDTCGVLLSRKNTFSSAFAAAAAAAVCESLVWSRAASAGPPSPSQPTRTPEPKLPSPPKASEPSFKEDGLVQPGRVRASLLTAQTDSSVWLAASSTPPAGQLPG